MNSFDITKPCRCRNTAWKLQSEVAELLQYNKVYGGIIGYEFEDGTFLCLWNKETGKHILAPNYNCADENCELDLINIEQSDENSNASAPETDDARRSRSEPQFFVREEEIARQACIPGLNKKIKAAQDDAAEAYNENQRKGEAVALAELVARVQVLESEAARTLLEQLKGKVNKGGSLKDMLDI